jgi:hypothetical protein
MKRIAVLLAILLVGCATVWRDGTGGGRDQSQFSMDDGACRLTAQDYGNQQQGLVNQQGPCYGTNKQCGWAAALNGVSVGQASQNAYGACMQSRGWMQTRR